ncbi:MAG: hypothetical protein JNJ60_24440 [Rhodocyclaceae bacterium]|nr:hypothetical protein [Rhodocyclaceae bacterium]
MDQANKRLFVIFAVLALPLAAWLVHEYFAYVPVVDAVPANATQAAALVPPAAGAPPPPAAPAPAQRGDSAARGNYAYKCRSASGTRYGSEACGSGEQQQVLRLPAPPAPAGPSVLLQQAAAVSSAGAAAPAPDLRPAATSTAALLIGSEQSADADECGWIDTRIQAIDALTRQPHSAREADFWRSERRRLSDRRHALHCRS